MKNAINSMLAKTVIDILMIFVFALTVSFCFAKRRSPHGYFGGLLSVLVMVHISQHWSLLKALIKKELGISKKTSTTESI